MNVTWVFQRVVLLIVVLLVGDISAVSGENNDSFTVEFGLLRQQRVAEVGRDPLVKAYKKFIDKFSRHPRIEEAMLDLGSIYEIVNPAANMKSEPELALKWYRSAANAAEPGSETWFRTQQLIINRTSDSAEKRAIIDLMSRHVNDNLAFQVQIEKNLMDICVLEKNYTDAGKHCRRIMKWYNDPARVPSDVLVKSEIDSVQRFAGNEFILRLAESRLPRSERKKLIEEFAGEFTFNQDIYLKDLDRARELANERGRFERQ